MAYVIQAMTKLHVYKWHNDAKVTERLDQEGRKVSARQIGLYIYTHITVGDTTCSVIKLAYNTFGS